ncbi:hypothetical protein ACFX2I_022647 [Malus domestica]
MSNIIEQQFKLNMKTETKEERTPNTPLMADCMCCLPPLECTALLLPPPMVAAQGGDGGGKARQGLGMVYGCCVEGVEMKNGGRNRLE